MSSSAQGGAGGSGDKPPGLSRFMRRASKVLRRSSSKRESSSSAQEDPSTVASGAAEMPIPEQAVMYVKGPVSWIQLTGISDFTTVILQKQQSKIPQKTPLHPPRLKHLLLPPLFLLPFSNRSEISNRVQSLPIHDWHGQLRPVAQSKKRKRAHCLRSTG